ncbi:MAG: amidase [Alphaproteobacteria bacterium]|nr:amidase [Alphaproteobacteria bacterium]MBU1517179.1 amidase [Alphaproteobacteria bacterium]MBU2093285.1 amidase [Alphaproteobacteria bacterium]MBU2150038.1 amidase [Alphaproteobacteria bacterium]MBU2307795.1 amidase [Alphaproteobacteria bacterium]
MSETLSHDLLDQTAGALVDALAAREVGALELTDAAIARIEARDGPINAVVVRDFDRARQSARAADAALGRGELRPLLGLPMTVKESNEVEGLPSTWGSPAFSGWVAHKDSVAVARLKAAGAIILGKTNVPPFLADWQSTNPVHGRTKNPWDLGRSPGGSSGGSAAAVAAGMSPLELGSDIGGSIRVPAAFCGIYGHKPSYGLVPTRGHAPPGLDGGPIALAVVGPLARSAADLDLALGVIAGPEPHEAKGYSLNLPPPRHADLADYRVLVVDQHPAAATDNEIREALDTLARGLDDLGARVDRSSDLLPDLAAQHAVFGALVGAAMSRGAPAGTTMTAHEWMDALDAQVMFRRRWAALFETVDVVVMPTFGVVAFEHVDEPDGARRILTVNSEATPYFNQIAWPGVALLPNLPATAAPIGFTRGGLPIGAQIIGPYLEDRTTIAFADLLAQAFGGFTAPPALT